MHDRRLPVTWLTLALMTVLLGGTAACGKDVPFLGGRVNDLAGLLNTSTETRLDQRLRKLEQSTGAQVVVLTIQSLEGDSLEDFAHRVATTWKLGQAGTDNGALLLIARDDRKMRIEVGYGLEGTVPDVIAKRILDEILRPRFRAGNFEGGIEAGVDVLAGLIEGDPDALPPRRTRKRSPGPFVGVAILGLPLAFFSLMAFVTKSRSAWLFWLFLAPFWFILPNAAIGWPIACVLLALWLVLFPLARILLRRTTAGGQTLDAIESILVATASSGAWSSSGGWGGNSGGGGSSGGGGFSGGGGSFGGGASSGW